MATQHLFTYTEADLVKLCNDIREKIKISLLRNKKKTISVAVFLSDIDLQYSGRYGTN